MIIPITELPAETLRNLVESFVLREGTDYGEEEVSLASKVIEIEQQLQAGKLLIVYSELHETVNIVRPEDVKSPQQEDE